MSKNTNAGKKRPPSLGGRGTIGVCKDEALPFPKSKIVKKIETKPPDK